MLKYTKVETNPQINADNIGQTEKISAPKKEPTVYQKVGSRLMREGRIAVLGLVLATACNNAEKTAVKTPAEPIPNTPVAQETVDAIPSQQSETKVNFQQTLINLKQIVEESPTENSLRQETAETITRFESVYASVSQLVAESEKEQTDGHPTLLVQEREMFANLNLLPLWEGKYQTEDAFLLDQIPFYRDQRILQEALTTLNNTKTPTVDQISHTLNNKGLSQLQIQEDVYNHLNEPQEKTITFTQENPLNTEIQQRLEKIPRLTPLIITFNDYEYLRGAQFTPNPPTISFRDVAGSVQTTEHETGHANDPIEDPNIYVNVTASKGIKLTIARNAAILKTRQYDDFKKMYSNGLITASKKENNHEPLNEQEISSKISFTPNRMVSNPEGRGTPFTKNAFASYLKNETIDSKANTQSADQKLYRTLGDFLTGERETLDLISAQNIHYKLVFDILKNNADDIYYFGEPTIDFPGSPVSTYYQTIRGEFAPAILTTLYLQNDPSLNVLPSAERIDTTQKLFTLIPYLNREQFAEGFSSAIDGNTSVFSSYLEEIKE